jgi:AcrR family transcriptional regulator
VARDNQKLRTRRAILDACRQLVQSGTEVTMPGVAQAALVSEATAYRYFPNLLSLLSEVQELLPQPSELLAAVGPSPDPVERVAFAVRALAEHVLAYQSAVRAMIAATITQPALVGRRPGLRFRLIDAALEPLSAGEPAPAPEQLARLKMQLAIVLSPEALFVLTDSYGLSHHDAVARVVELATALTRAVVDQTPGRVAHNSSADRTQAVTEPSLNSAGLARRRWRRA